MVNVIKKMRGLFITLLLTIVASGCTKEHPERANTGIDNISANTPIVAQDQSEKSEHLISSENGGVISVPCGTNGRVDIGFMGGAVDQDRVFEVSSINLSTGFYLEEKGIDGHVNLKMPASICYVTLDEIPQDTMIVKYHNDGKGYSVIPTQQVQMDGVNGLIAFADSFSGYGIKSVSKAELDEMANSLEKAGFDWVLRIDDKVQGNMGPYVIYEVAGLIEMKNTEAPNPRVMQGPYRGQVVIRDFADITVEGQTVYTVIEESDREAEFTLYPVFETYEPEPGSDLPMLCGLVAKSYAGKGVLKLRQEIKQGQASEQGGINILDIVDPLANQWGTPISKVIHAEMPFTVTTEGPMAYFNFNMGQIGPITLTGSIVGYPKKSEEPEEAPRDLELAPLVVDKKATNQEAKTEIENDDIDDGSDTDYEEFFPDEEALRDLLPPKEEDLRFHENEDGSVDYDSDGDGEPDIRLSPLVVKH